MGIRDLAKDVYGMVGQGQLLEAFDKYYHQDVVMEEPRGTRSGKADCRSYEEQFLSSVEAVHGMEIRALAADEDKSKTVVEVMMDITFKGGMRVQMEQVAVQTWKDGQIIHERFYYDNAAG